VGEHARQEVIHDQSIHFGGLIIETCLKAKHLLSPWNGSSRSLYSPAVDVGL
jgi:hypothetical protein